MTIVGAVTGVAGGLVGAVKLAHKVSRTAWSSNPIARGRRFEDVIFNADQSRLGINLNEMKPNFRTFDAWNADTGLATSIKSLDGLSPSRLKAGRLASEINGYARAARNFVRDGKGNEVLLADDIRQREVIVALPPGLSRAQRIELRNAAGTAASGQPPVTIRYQTKWWQKCLVFSKKRRQRSLGSLWLQVSTV